MASELYLMEVGDGRYSILLCDDRSITRMPALTPAETLIAFSELDYTDYRKAVRWLRNEHPLFEERIDIPVSDLEDFAAEAILLTPDLCEIDPVSGFVVTDILHQTLQAEDDGTAMFLLVAGQEILRVMEEPLRVQNYLRNIMEVAFDSTAGMTPAEQYEKLRATYADIARICNPAKLPRLEKPRSFQLRSLMELRMLVLALYFEQDNQRVCRCDYCWGYFIPKTKKATRYCDRVTDGQSCKQRGANLARLDKTSEDEALLVCKKLRDRMYSRLLRWIDAAPSDRSNLMHMDYEQYDQWSENARLAREEYIKQALQMTYSFVFLDEFQDTTAIQYAFVKECFWNSGTKVTSVGDNKQRIMVWAGAVKTIFNDFYRELNPKCIRLIMNHRSAPRLVALQKAMYESLKEKATEVCASGNWAEDDGNIALFIADNEQLEAAAVSKDILLKISNGVEPHDICILCKQKPQDYASAVIEELEKHGVRARIETGYQDLIKEPIVDLFIKFMICADSRKHPNEWTFIEELLVELWGISGMRENDTFDEMQRKLSAVVNVVKKNIQQKLDTEQWHSTLNSIIDFFGIGNIKAKFPAYKQGTYFMNVINQFESLFFEEYVAAHGVWNLAIENFRGDHSVPIMTIHKSKGLEYNAVYFIGLEDSAFWNFRNQPDEDRCTFFVALSRAKASVTFTFCKKRSGMKCPMQRHNAINEFFDLLQRPGIAEVKRFQNR